jgi:O-antigen/teichoic acid export membrane protein
MIAVGLVVNALIQSVTTRLARLFADGEVKQFVRLLTKLSMIGVLMAAIGIPMAYLVGRPLLTLIYRREYAEHVGLLALLMGVSGVTTIGAFLYCGMNAARLFRPQVPVYVVASLVCLAGSAIFIPLYGLIGAGVAVLLSATTIVLGGLVAMRKALKARASECGEWVQNMATCKRTRG